MTQAPLMNTPHTSPDLSSLRVQIDNIDQQLLTARSKSAKARPFSGPTALRRSLKKSRRPTLGR